MNKLFNSSIYLYNIYKTLKNSNTKTFFFFFFYFHKQIDIEFGEEFCLVFYRAIDKLINIRSYLHNIKKYHISPNVDEFIKRSVKYKTGSSTAGVRCFNVTQSAQVLTLSSPPNSMSICLWKPTAGISVEPDIHMRTSFGFRVMPLMVAPSPFVAWRNRTNCWPVSRSASRLISSRYLKFIRPLTSATVTGGLPPLNRQVNFSCLTMVRTSWVCRPGRIISNWVNATNSHLIITQLHVQMKHSV